jgi:hypothetical protein
LAVLFLIEIMAHGRLARVVIPGLPHHVTQRGKRTARTFFGDDDYALYRDLLAASCRAARTGHFWQGCFGCPSALVINASAEMKRG